MFARCADAGRSNPGGADRTLEARGEPWMAPGMGLQRRYNRWAAEHGRARIVPRRLPKACPWLSLISLHRLYCRRAATPSVTCPPGSRRQARRSDRGAYHQSPPWNPILRADTTPNPSASGPTTAIGAPNSLYDWVSVLIGIWQNTDCRKMVCPDGKGGPTGGMRGMWRRGQGSWRPGRAGSVSRSCRPRPSVGACGSAWCWTWMRSPSTRSPAGV